MPHLLGVHTDEKQLEFRGKRVIILFNDNVQYGRIENKLKNIPDNTDRLQRLDSLILVGHTNGTKISLHNDNMKLVSRDRGWWRDLARQIDLRNYHQCRIGIETDAKDGVILVPADHILNMVDKMNDQRFVATWPDVNEDNPGWFLDVDMHESMLDYLKSKEARHD